MRDKDQDSLADKLAEIAHLEKKYNLSGVSVQEKDRAEPPANDIIGTEGLVDYALYATRRAAELARTVRSQDSRYGSARV